MSSEPEPKASGPVALVFPGQGAQRPGMAKDFHDDSPLARLVFEEASDATDLDIAKICFEDKEKLNLTEFTQPCILTAEVAMLRVLEAEYGLNGELFAGHSLGEYTALVAAGVLDLGDAARLVRRRGALMQEAVPAGDGAMLAVIGQEEKLATLEEWIDGLEVDPANHNSPGQIVISGSAKDVEEAHERLKGHGFRCVPVNVSAPFHSRFMKGIEKAFAEELSSVEIESEPAPRVASNYTGEFHEADADSIRKNLVAQISGTVKWAENMHVLLTRTNRIFEIGPNRPLSGFFREIGVMPVGIRNLEAARKTFAASEEEDL